MFRSNLLQRSVWLNRKGYIQGVVWTLIGCLLSNMNDILMKSTSDHLSSFQIVFFRSFLGLLITIPFFLYKREPFKTVNFRFHLIRIFVGAAAITLACYSTSLITLPEVTALSFCQPLLFLPAACLFLKEKLTLSRVVGNIVGFLGVFIVLNPENQGMLSPACIIPLSSAALFMLLDVVTKKYVELENPLKLIFYFNFGTALLTGLLSFFNWKALSWTDFCLLFLLGLSSTLIQLFSFLSLAATQLLSLAPVRYAELFFSCIFSFLLFNDPPTLSVIGGGGLIAAGILFTSFYESRRTAQ